MLERIEAYLKQDAEHIGLYAEDLRTGEVLSCTYVPLNCDH